MRPLSNVLGIGVDKIDAPEVLKKAESFISEGTPHQISYVNAHCVNHSFVDKEYRKAVSNSDLVYADGMAIVWASYFYGDPLPGRVNLGDFLFELCKLCVRKSYSIFLLGGVQGAAEKAAENLIKNFPNLKIAGTHNGFFNEEDAAVIDIINRSSADIVLVGMGVPRQEKWIAKNKNRLNTPVIWGVGGLLDYYAGRIRRAPVWMRKAGLEWLFRLSVEPARLWKRYVIGNILFLSRLFLPVIVDILSVTASWVSAYWLRFFINPMFKVPIGFFVKYCYMIPLLALTWPFICSFSGLYNTRRRYVQISQLVDMLKAVSTGLIFMIVASYVFRELGIARSFLAIWALTNFFFLIASRSLLNRLSPLSSGNLVAVNTLIVGNDDESLSLKEKLEQSMDARRVVRFLTEPGKLDETINRYGIEEVVLADKNMPLSEKLNLATRYLDKGVVFRITFQDLQPFVERVRLNRLENTATLELSSYKQGIAYILSKELLDKIISFAAVLATLPLWLIIVLLIKADSKGRAIFVHERVGKDGKLFRLYKFRTMFKDTPPNGMAPLKDGDPRITRVGKLLRHWSLDELPQLLNVLKGDMSLVGPRPEMPFIVENYQPWQRERLRVKPGITGMWQIAGRKEIPLKDNIEYDFYYIHNRSFILDLVILLKSIPAIILRKGAY